MKTRILLAICALSMAFCGIHAQIIVDIEAGGGPGPVDPYYEPQFVSIEVGDMVRWTNSGGTHNVDGTLDAYPDNPEGFTNGDPSSDQWVFTHTFTIPGVYGFECSAYDHNLTQFGTVTVTDPAVGIEELTDIELTLYPNPSTEYLRIEASEPIDQISIYTLDMKKVVESDQRAIPSKIMEIRLEGLESGQYFVSLLIDGKRTIEAVVIQ